MSDPAQDLGYLTYIRDAIALIEARARIGHERFLREVDVQDAILWRLEILAEATGKLSSALKDRHPDVRWRAIYGFRNVAAHAYRSIDLNEVWNIIEVHVPALKEVVDQEIHHLGSS